METGKRYLSDFALEGDEPRKPGKEELLERLAIVEAERRELIEKLAEYEELELPPIKLENPTELKSEQKSLFLFELFDGRKDVYANKYYNKKQQKYVYGPVCANLFKSICSKSNKYQGIKVSCSECAYNEKDKLTPKVIMDRQLMCKHPDGEGAIGIYPLKDGNVCRFAAIDLDESTWADDAKAILVTARSAGFPLAIEKSFSGNGAHLWLFFSEDISAKMARELFFTLMEEATRRYRTIPMRSYDRIFPSQDELSGKGFGNLILMPLVRSAVLTYGTTAFLDDDMVPYVKQVDYLTSLPKVSRKQIEDYLAIARTPIISDIEIEPLWRRKLPAVSKKEIKGELVLYEGSGITLDKSAMSRTFQLMLRRMASFSNPAYYKALAKHENPEWKNLQPTLHVFVENEQVIWLPRGFGESLKRILEKSNIPFHTESHRTSGANLHITSDIILKDNQVEPYEKLKSTRMGILKAAPSFGKTIIAISLIAHFRERTLILVSSKDVHKQWISRLEEHLVVEEAVPEELQKKRRKKSPIGVIAGPTRSRTSLIDVAMIQTLSSMTKETRPDFLDDYGLVIVDECHHLAAETYEPLMRLLRPSRIYGLSATDKRSDSLEKLVYAHLGPVLYEIQSAELAKERGIRQYLIPRFTTAVYAEKYHSKLLDLLTEDEKRNELIATDIVQAYREGRKILVLTQRIKHIAILAELLKEENIPVIEYLAEDVQTVRKEKRSLIDADSEGRNVILSTVQFTGEGTDIPHLDTLFQLLPYSFEGRTIQAAGRIARESVEKAETYIYDYADILIPQCEKMYEKRLKAYRKMGYSVKGEEHPRPLEGLYTEAEVLPPLLSSIAKAKKSIHIAARILNPSSRTRSLIDLLSEKQKSIKITIKVTECQNEKYLANHSATLRILKEKGLEPVILKSLKAAYLIVDEEEIWHGEVPFLGFKKRESGNDDEITVLSFYNSRMALDLIRADDNLF